MTVLTETVVGGVLVQSGQEITPTPPTPQEIAMQAIVSMEREQLMPRLSREFILAAMKKEAEDEGISEAQLEAKNKGYRLLKAFDAQITALRAQL